MSNIDEWNTSWMNGEIPTNNINKVNIPSEDSPSPRQPIKKDFSNRDGFINDNGRRPFNKERFRRPKKECRWGSDCRQAQIYKANLGNEKDEDHIRYFSHPAIINDPPKTDCKNGEECWAISMRNKAIEENEEVPFEVKRHCFFFHMADSQIDTNESEESG